MRRTDVVAWSALGVSFVALGVHAAYYFPFFSDDALISLRYSERLCSGAGLTWTAGKRVEGYTDLLWVLLNAPAACVRADPMWSARVLDFIGAVLTVWVVAWDAARAGVPRLARVLGGGMTLAFSAPLAVWAVGGLEHGFMTGMLALGLWFARKPAHDGVDGAAHLESDVVRDSLRASLFFGLLALLRADGVVLFAGATAGRWIFREGRRGGLKAALAWLSFPVAFLSAQLIFRLSYYGEFVPNTFVAKVSVSVFRVHQGLVYLKQGFTPMVTLVAAAMLSLGLCTRKVPSPCLAIPAGAALSWAAYVGFVGGDIFPGWRQLLFSLVALGFVVADGAEEVARRFADWRGYTVIAAWTLVLGAQLRLQFWDSEDVRAKHELWEWGGKPVGFALKGAFARQKPLLAVDAAGALPYWSELPALDMLGLNDAYIPRHPPPGFGRGVIGHELGDPDYVWRTRPDILAFCGSVGSVEPCFVSGQGIFARRDFHETYQLVRIKADRDGTFGNVYVRREDAKVGVVRSADRVIVPGYLFTQAAAVAIPSATGELVADIRPEMPARIERLKLSAGTWTLATDPVDDSLAVAFTCDGVSPRRASGSNWTLHLGVPAAVDVSIGIPEGRTTSIQLVRATLTRDHATAGFECDRSTRFGPVERSLADLDRHPVEGIDWSEPEAVRFNPAGLHVSLPHVMFITGFELAGDGNDTYQVRFMLAGREVGRAEVPAGAVGMHARRVEVTTEVAESGADALLITPLRGDDAYSVGALIIHE